jgi:hypothetical protein
MKPRVQTPVPHQKGKNRGLGRDSTEQSLSSMRKALGAIPSATKGENKELEK